MKLDKLLKAFTLAHHAAENDKYDAATRKLFRTIARAIWDSVSAGEVI